MLNYIWLAMIILAVILGGINGKIEDVTKSAIDSAGNAVVIAIGLIGIMALWLGIVKIAEDLGITRQTVAKKIEQMHASGLMISFFPKMEPELLGLSIQAYILMREDPRSDCRKETEEIVKSYPQVAEFQRIFGKYDSIAKVLVKNNKELSDLVKKIHNLNGVKETETFIVHSTVKDKPDDPFKKALTQEAKCFSIY